MDLFDKILREAAARRQYAQTLKPETRRFPARARPDQFLIVSPSCNPGGAWRVTLFDEKGPICHSETGNHAAAILETWNYGGDIWQFETA